MIKNLDDKEKKRLRKQLEKLLAALKAGVIFVEGKKDREAFVNLGCKQILTISGNLAYSCELAKKMNASEVIVLTDMDESGDELAEKAKSELERRNIKANLDARRHLSRLLCLKEFEAAYKKYEEVLNELNK
jgi:5S rRNA maturation endonuclease (ribonuclease M5)